MKERPALRKASEAALGARTSQQGQEGQCTLYTVCIVYVYTHMKFGLKVLIAAGTTQRLEETTVKYCEESVRIII